jgi:hypothetical protein
LVKTVVTKRAFDYRSLKENKGNQPLVLKRKNHRVKKKKVTQDSL